jgi:2-hydroxychromene-2-carboxylate isomerase
MNLKTRVRSAAMRRFSSLEHLEKQRTRARKRRAKQGGPPTVHYFHQTDDPYSHLAVQKLDQLKARYDLRFQPHLVSEPDAPYQGDAEHFSLWALRDAASVAADYGTTFSPTLEAPPAHSVAMANQALATHLDQEDFAQIATAIGNSLWTGESIDLTDSSNAGESAVREGNAQRQALGHYQGAMFYFEGEWFWGIDRMRLLEQRLALEGFDRESGPPCVPEPTPIRTTGKDTDGILLEYFPSLRSPYTAIGHRRVLDLVASSGVTVHVRPVMPMMMRGIPAPREKQRYIIVDSGREGREHGSPFGRIVDPFGEPVKRAFALFPGADALGMGMDFVTAYLNAAWFEGIDITTVQGLRQVAINAGLDWQSLVETSNKEDWEAVLASNLQALARENLWGVPSFRVTGGKASAPYACWGQDRIWRVANEIARRA